MQARDVMTSDVATVSPEAGIRDIAKLLLQRQMWNFRVMTRRLL